MTINLNGAEARPFLLALADAAEKSDWTRWADVCGGFADWLGDNGRPDLEEAFRDLASPQNALMSMGHETVRSMGLVSMRNTGFVTARIDTRTFDLTMSWGNDHHPVASVTKRRQSAPPAYIS